MYSLGQTQVFGQVRSSRNTSIISHFQAVIPGQSLTVGNNILHKVQRDHFNCSGLAKIFLVPETTLSVFQIVLISSKERYLFSVYWKNIYIGILLDIIFPGGICDPILGQEFMLHNGM